MLFCFLNIVNAVKASCDVIVEETNSIDPLLNYRYTLNLYNYKLVKMLAVWTRVDKLLKKSTSF